MSNTVDHHRARISLINRFPGSAMALTSLAIAVLATGAIWLLAPRTQAAMPGGAMPPAGVTPLGPHFQAQLPPLPVTGYVPPRPPQIVAAVYQFAAEHPEVLSYVPCYCGCQQGGHRSNEDCFVKQRAANGDVIAWEPHGLECTVCIDVAQQSMQLKASGASVREIRTAIERTWDSRSQSKTPTPPAPAK